MLICACSRLAERYTDRIAASGQGGKPMSKAYRLMQRAVHFLQRIQRESRVFPANYSEFGWNVSRAIFQDGLIPPGKSKSYLNTIYQYVNEEMKDYNRQIEQNGLPAEHPPKKQLDKFPVWTCWWQGEESMPELVRVCRESLKRVLPQDCELHLVTFDNYQEYVDIPTIIMKRFEAGEITMTALSDVLRFELLSRYGGYWADATLLFGTEFPVPYVTRDIYCQKMTDNAEMIAREACQGKWCGFSMAGKPGNPVFVYMTGAFPFWWEKHHRQADYVQIDYLLLCGYNNIPAVRSAIDSVENNDQEIFTLYGLLNKPYDSGQIDRLFEKNRIHKLSYKETLNKTDENGQQTVYGYLAEKYLKEVQKEDSGKEGTDLCSSVS